MDLTEVFDLFIDAVAFIEEIFDDFRFTIFDKTISFVDIVCVVFVYQLINYVVYGKDDD